MTGIWDDMTETKHSVLFTGRPGNDWSYLFATPLETNAENVTNHERSVGAAGLHRRLEVVA